MKKTVTIKDQDIIITEFRKGLFSNKEEIVKIDINTVTSILKNFSEKENIIGNILIYYSKGYYQINIDEVDDIGKIYNDLCELVNKGYNIKLEYFNEDTEEFS